MVLGNAFSGLRAWQGRAKAQQQQQMLGSTDVNGTHLENEYDEEKKII
jgi:hypothetical protein